MNKPTQDLQAMMCQHIAEDFFEFCRDDWATAQMAKHVNELTWLRAVLAEYQSQYLERLAEGDCE